MKLFMQHPKYTYGVSEKPKKHRNSKRSKKLKPDDTSSDDLMVIEESKLHRVSDILTGKAKRKEEIKPSRLLTSTMMMQEAKQLMEKSSRSSCSNVLSRPSISISTTKKYVLHYNLNVHRAIII